MIYRIASFNLHGLKESEDKEQDYQIIADIIRGIRPIKVHQHNRKNPENYCFHLVAIQEVPNSGAFNEFMRFLPGWKGVQVSPNGYSKRSAEGYAFLWDTKWIDLMPSEDPQKDGPFFKPHILSATEDNKIRVDFSEVQKLTRMPLYGRFRLKHCNTEFRLLNTHLTFGISKALPEEYRELTGKAQRLEEYRILTQIVYPAVNRFCYKNGFQNYYTILMGDYNLNLNRPWTDNFRVFNEMKKKYRAEMAALDSFYAEKVAIRRAVYDVLPKIPKTAEEYEYTDGNYTQHIVTKQDQLTTFTNKNGKDYKIERVVKNLKKLGVENITDLEIEKMRHYLALADEDFRVYKNNFDHMSYDQDRLKEIIVSGPKRCDDIVRAYFEDDSVDSYRLDRAASMYKKKVSDHLPIVVEISLNQY